MRITIADRSADAVVGDDGAWVVQLGPLEPGGPYRLEVRVDGGDEPVIAHDVYAGEVFICAGQSNMEYQMEFLRWRYPSEYTREPDPLLRHCKVPVRFDFHGPRRDFDEPVRWVGAVADTLDEFTGVGYFFGRMVRAWLGVPVGLLNITLGGSPIESWMDEETLAAWPKALADLEPYRDYMVPEGVLKAGCNEIDVRLVVEHGTGRVTPGKHMHLDMGDDSYNLDGTWTYSIGARTDADCPGEDFVRWKPLGLYNGMTATCAGYAARAALWYQGESNTGDVADDYGRMLAAMIGCWRKAWGQQRLPFLIVQLPVFSIDGVEDGGWALVRKHQWQAAKSIEDVAAVVTLDAGDWNDLHPWNKSVVADRLFAAAQRLVYGKDDAPRSPEPTGVRLADGRLTIAFDDGTGDCGLDTMDGADPGEFELVWEDGSRHTVPARVEGNTVVIDVPWRRPAAVRYAWRNAPSHGLLCGSNGLPIPPFAESIA